MNFRIVFYFYLVIFLCIESVDNSIILLIYIEVKVLVYILLDYYSRSHLALICILFVSYYYYLIVIVFCLYKVCNLFILRIYIRGTTLHLSISNFKYNDTKCDICLLR